MRRRAHAKALLTGTAARSAAERKKRVVAARVSTVSLKGVLADHGMVCGICSKAIEHKSQLTFDHVIPLARGGAHANENLRPAHRSCNAWKRDRLPEEIAGLVPPSPGEVDVEWEERRRAAASSARSEAIRLRMASMTPEQRAVRAAKISAATRGKRKRQFLSAEALAEVKAKASAKRTPESRARAAEAARATWAAKTPEEREAWRQRCRTIKAASKTPKKA